MCLILFSWKDNSQHKLILAANRDEFYARPTSAADFWEDQPDILGGRDLEAGGTWMGLTRQGRFAAITNYRDPSIKRENAPSRGALTTDFLMGAERPGDYLEKIDKEADRYYGYNLLVSDGEELWYYSNISKQAKALGPGSYGLSNALLDTAWPKVKLGKELFRSSVVNGSSQSKLLEVLGNDEKPADKDLPKTGVPYEWEKAISSMFIETETYGTCCSTILLIDHENQARFVEKSYPVGDRAAGEKAFDLKLGQ